MNKVTIEEAKGRVRYVRCHVDKVPGTYSLAFALEEQDTPGVWKAKIAMESMTLEQRRDFTKAVEKEKDICSIIWVREMGVGVRRSVKVDFKCGCREDSNVRAST